MRDIPPQLVRALRHARSMERLARHDGSAGQLQRAINATGAVILAAVEIGWQQAEIADAIGLHRQTVHERLKAARRIYGDQTPALVYDAPLDHPPTLRDELARPVEEREWLTRPEAADLVGRHPYTIHNWRRAGLLPHTRMPRPGQRYLYLRADVLRAAAGQRYHGQGVHYTAVRAQITGADTGDQ